ncbi:MAG: hypothetical protein ABIS67_02310 [Candidatus Eisenbacteria bacterium]
MFPFAPRPRLAALRFASVHALFLALIATPAFAQGTGRSLDIQPGARQNGLGAAGAALFGEASGALWWNPALLGFAKQVSIQGTHAKLLPGLASDIDYYHAAAVVPAGPIAVGVSYTKLNYGVFGGFESNERSPSVAVAVRVLPGLALGATAKRIRIDLAPSLSGESNGYDIGGALRIPLDRLTFGLGVNHQNFGGRVTFVNSTLVNSTLSENLKIGASAEMETELAPGITLGTVVVVDYNQSMVTEEFDTWHGGVEFSNGYRDLFRVAARLGYYYDPLGEIEDFTFGAGARVRFVTVDGAWIPQAKNSGLDRVFKVTAGLHFDFPRRSR